MSERKCEHTHSFGVARTHAKPYFKKQSTYDHCLAHFVHNFEKKYIEARISIAHHAIRAKLTGDSVHIHSAVQNARREEPKKTTKNHNSTIFVIVVSAVVKHRRRWFLCRQHIYTEIKKNHSNQMMSYFVYFHSMNALH